MDKLKKSIVNKFMNADGTINKTVVASFITLLIVLAQQIMIACGFSYGHWDQIVAIINTLLTLLGLCGFVEGNGEVEVPTTNSSTTSDSLGQKTSKNVQGNLKGDDKTNETQAK